MINLNDKLTNIENMKALDSHLVLVLDSPPEHPRSPPCSMSGLARERLTYRSPNRHPTVLTFSFNQHENSVTLIHRLQWIDVKTSHWISESFIFKQVTYECMSIINIGRFVRTLEFLCLKSRTGFLPG